MQCPMGSNSTGGAVSECTCNDGLATADGSTTTTSDRCDQCRAGYYRDGGCVRCPAMSGRVFSDNEATCTCNQGYRHPNGSVDTTTEDCVGEDAVVSDQKEVGRVQFVSMYMTLSRKLRGKVSDLLMQPLPQKGSLYSYCLCMSECEYL